MAVKNPKSIAVRDVIHGSIDINPWELDIIDSPFFQRLRNIKQLGFSELAYPGATHNRYSHSIGAMHLAGQLFQSIFRAQKFSSTEKYYNYLYASRLATLLHDIGHGPFSHAIEFAMPMVSTLGLAQAVTGNRDRQATHEDYTIKIILESSLTPLLEKACAGLDCSPYHIACIINPELKEKDDFFVDQETNYRKILHQLTSSEIDADRMDYLRRDSYYTGATYGNFDSMWLLNNLSFYVTEEKKGTKLAHLALSNRAIYTFEDFLLSRYHMFLMVYHHHKSVVFEKMLEQYLRSPENDFHIPSDIEAYVHCDDAYLYAHLRNKAPTNDWARRVMQRQPYLLRLEVHGGLGATLDPNMDPRVCELELKLKNENIFYLKTSSQSGLSKYFHPTDLKPKTESLLDERIFVEVQDRLNKASYVPLEEFTDLFRRYAEKKSIVRIYVPEKVFTKIGSIYNKN